MKITKATGDERDIAASSSAFRVIDFFLRNKKFYLPVIFAVLGLVLLIIGNFDSEKKDNVKANIYPDVNSKYDMIEYSAYIEDKIEKLCLRIKGVDRVNAIVILENGFEYVYAQNIKSESDGKSYYEISEYLLTEVDGDENVIYITGRAPKISGIGIVYSGLEDEKIRLEIINLISAAFDVKKSRIYVGK